MRGIVVPMIVALAAGSGCGGKPKSQAIPLPGGATLNYAPDGVTAERAHAVGRVLTREIGAFNWEGHLLHEPKGYAFGLFVPPGVVDDAGLAQWLRVIARDVSREACDGEPVHVALLTRNPSEVKRYIPFTRPRPPLPVELAFRDAALKSGLVGRFRNTSDRHLVVIAHLVNPTTHSSARREVRIGPKAVTEVGWLEGWNFASGERVVLEHADYESDVLLVP